MKANSAAAASVTSKEPYFTFMASFIKVRLRETEPISVFIRVENVILCFLDEKYALSYCLARGAS